MQITCLILDDEPLARQVLERFITQVPQLEPLGSFGQPEEVIAFLQKRSVDLLFLDIKMPSMEGTNLLRMLPNPPAVIFVTAFPEYAVEGFDLQAVDYLLKPFSFQRFLQAIKRVNEHLVQQPSTNSAGSLLIRADKKWYPIPYADIQYLQAYGDYVKVFLANEMLLTKDKLSRLFQEDLSENLFFQVHRSYVISIAAVDYLEGNQVFINGKGIPISAAKKEHLLELLGKR